MIIYIFGPNASNDLLLVHADHHGYEFFAQQPAKSDRILKTLTIKLQKPEMNENIINTQNFQNIIDEHFAPFELSIDICNEEAYKAAFSCATAQIKNVVYLFRSQRKVPRLVHESDILYIGQTQRSFESRYLPCAKWISGLNRNRNAHEKYGSIRLSVCSFNVFDETLRAAENRLLWHYYCNHFEYPPFNYTKASKPKVPSVEVQRLKSNSELDPSAVP